MICAALLLASCAATEPSAPATETPAPSDSLACGPRDAFVSYLITAYGEAPIAFGLADGFVLEVWASENGETWTALASNPEGISCLLGAGENWQGAGQSPASIRYGL